MADTNEIDIFDFDKFSHIRDVLKPHYTGIELYFKTAIVIDYLMCNTSSPQFINEFINSFIKCPDLKLVDTVGKTFSKPIILAKMYAHLGMRLTVDVELILQKYKTYENELFNRIYRKHVDPNHVTQILWF